MAEPNESNYSMSDAMSNATDPNNLNAEGEHASAAVDADTTYVSNALDDTNQDVAASQDAADEADYIDDSYDFDDLDDYDSHEDYLGEGDLAEDDFVTLRIIDPDVPSPTSAKRQAGIHEASAKTYVAPVDVKPFPLARWALVAGIIICILIACAVVAYKFFATPTHDEIKRPYVSEATSLVLANTEYRPDFSRYAYIKTDGLDAPNIYDVTVGDVYYAGDDQADAYCDVTAKATYRNDYLTATSEFSIKLAYDKKTETWVDAGIIICLKTIEPVSGPDIDALSGDILTTLGTSESGAGLASRMAGASIETSSTVGKNGGSIEFVLTKSARGGSSTTNTTTSSNSLKSSNYLELVVDEQLEWTDAQGWVATITQVGDIEEKSPKDTSSASSSAASSSDSSSASTETLTPTKQLVCSAGDLVQIEGTVINSGEGWMLKANDVIKVVLDGQEIVLQYFALSGETSTLTNGGSTSIVGKLTTTNDTAMPLTITL